MFSDETMINKREMAKWLCEENVRDVAARVLGHFASLRVNYELWSES